jgi:hypothetical protein
VQIAALSTAQAEADQVVEVDLCGAGHGARHGYDRAGWRLRAHACERRQPEATQRGGDLTRW